MSEVLECVADFRELMLHLMPRSSRDEEIKLEAACRDTDHPFQEKWIETVSYTHLTLPTN